MRIVLAAFCLAVSAWALATPAAANDRHRYRLVERYADTFYGAILQPQRRFVPLHAPSHMGSWRHHVPAWAPPHHRRGHHVVQPQHRRHGPHRAQRPVNPNVLLNQLHRRHWYQFGPLRFDRGHYHLFARDRHHRPYRLVVDPFTVQILRIMPY